MRKQDKIVSSDVCIVSANTETPQETVSLFAVSFHSGVC